MALRPLIVICGTTGVGKSKLAIELALAIAQGSENRRHDYRGARIINADAMQVYHGMDIITNKVPVQEMCGIEHLLMGFKQPGEQYFVTEWVRDAMKAIEETHKRNEVPIVVGGTSYWVQHLLFPNRLVSADQNSALSSGDSSVGSEELKPLFASLPAELLDLFNALPARGPSAGAQPGLAMSLYNLLSALDPKTAKLRHWKDTRKVLRSLCIIRDTGRRPSSIYAEQSENIAIPRYRTLLFWLYAKPDILKPRLDARVDRMVEQGLLNEIRALRSIASAGSSVISFQSQGEEETGSREPDIDYTLGIYQSIGYKEFHEFLSNPTSSDDAFQAALESMKSATRKYAKRQIMWIRNQLLPAVNAANNTSRTNIGSDIAPAYVLDATELGESWETNVRATACKITEDFLDEKDLPEPISLSKTACELLSKPAELQARPLRICETCTIHKDSPVMIKEGNAWKAHQRTRVHRKRFKKAHMASASSQCRADDRDSEIEHSASSSNDEHAFS
ncbi:tRNA isopentenyltransferase [Laetiporus sulphureus 93-53]|uniref:tRNA isopentenyltransferase n=1 Tax=Laetiporus sulphureus 93-53 TaxID=1314785 RepID=A0A165HA27_9APHY|nr:tRNA isopentenyltransferase [Laetiporus sulphureus 93-53]KZT11452.1 tRNA isopentenyltransferase [Laetiporus sulphureus 93-53]